MANASTNAALPRPAVRPHPFPAWGDPLVAALVGVGAALTAAVPLIGNPYFYFADDFQMFFLPVFQEIAQQLKAGQFPLMTDRTWFGGAILAEYQFAVFNPVSLILYVLIDSLDRLDHAAATYALFHISVLAAGIFTLCRGLHIGRPEAALAALAGSTSMWVIYWGAQTWICALVGIAWLPWALSFLLRARRDPRHIPSAALVTALALVSGWPYTIVALAVIVGAATAADLLLHRHFWSYVRVAVSLAFAFALAAPALLPLWYYLGESTRLEVGLPNVFQADLGTLVAAGLPTFPDTWRVFSGRDRFVLSPPMHYASWFIPLVLVNANWAGLRGKHLLSGVTLVLIAVGLGGLSMVGAGWHFRMPFRLLPYYHIALAVLSAWLITHARTDVRQPEIWKRRRTVVTLIVLFGMLLTKAPAVTTTEVILMVWIGALVLLSRWLQTCRPQLWLLAPALGHITLFAFLTAAFPHNDLVPHWRPPVVRNAVPDGEQSSLRQLSLFQRLGPDAPRGPDASFGFRRGVGSSFWAEIMPGNTSLYHPVEAIHGYSAVQPRGLYQAFCFDYIGSSCADAAQRVLAVDRANGLSTLDLVRADRVVAQRGLHAERFASQAGAAWVRAAGGEHSEVFLRREPLPVRPGSTSVIPPGMHLQLLDRQPHRESYWVDPGHQGGRIVWARAWYPGYRAFLNGQSVELEPVKDLLPSVTLLPREGGELVLEYFPEGLGLGLVIAGSALIGLLALWVGLGVRMKSIAEPGRTAPPAATGGRTRIGR